MRQRYIAEFIGTFGIVFAPVGISATGTLPSSDSGLMASAWVSGLSVLAMVYALGHISAAHFNPAVTLGFAIARSSSQLAKEQELLVQLGTGQVKVKVTEILDK